MAHQLSLQNLRAPGSPLVPGTTFGWIAQLNLPEWWVSSLNMLLRPGGLSPAQIWVCSKHGGVFCQGEGLRLRHANRVQGCLRLRQPFGDHWCGAPRWLQALAPIQASHPSISGLRTQTAKLWLCECVLAQAEQH